MKNILEPAMEKPCSTEQGFPSSQNKKIAAIEASEIGGRHGTKVIRAGNWIRAQSTEIRNGRLRGGRIPTDMPDSVVPSHPGAEHRKNPNFFAVVVMSAIALLVMFVGALLIVWFSGRHILPQAHRAAQPAAYLTGPGAGERRCCAPASGSLADAASAQS
jgi:hypothetical protein